MAIGRGLGRCWLACALLAGFSGACAEKRLEIANPQWGDAAVSVKVAKVRGAARLPLTSVGEQRQGSTIALATLGKHRIAFIADEDAGVVRAVDPDGYSELGRAKLKGKPSQLLVAADGRIYVAVRNANEVVALEVDIEDTLDASAPLGKLKLSQLDSFATGSEPVALAATPDGESVLVVSAWSRSLAAHRLRDLSKTFEIRLPREPRGVTVTKDGKHAFVAHAVGTAVSRVALDAPASKNDTDGASHALASVELGGRDFTPPRRRFVCRLPQPDLFFLGVEPLGPNEHSRKASQGFAIASDERVVVPLVLVHRGRVMTGGYGTSESYPSHQPAVAMVAAEADGDSWLRVQNRAWIASKSRSRFNGGATSAGCFLPRAVAIDSERELMLVSCLGSNDVRAYSTGNEALVLSQRGHWKVPAGPTGIALDGQRGEALVWSQFDRGLSTMALPEAESPSGDDKPQRAMSRVRAAFLERPKAPARSAILAAVQADGASSSLSASWQRGRRLFHAAGDKRISIDGRACASCHPDGRDDGISWPTPAGARQTPMLAGRVSDGGPFGWQGEHATLEDHIAHTLTRLGGSGLADDDMSALVSYIEQLPTPARHFAGIDSDARVARGKALFESEMVGCASCHRGGDGSDGNNHEVGSGATLDTPSLRFIAGTGPYYHDGRFGTLGELLRATKGQMGWASDMKPTDLQALEAYLRTL